MENEKARVVEKLVVPPNTGLQTKPETVRVDMAHIKQLDKETYLFLLYAMFKFNMITRHQLKNLLRFMEDYEKGGCKWDIPQILVDEAAKV